MKCSFCVPVIFCALFFSFVMAQQKGYFIMKELPVPDSLTAQMDSLMSKEVDQHKLRNGWPKLRKGLSPGEVRNLLGNPSKIGCSNLDASETWYYGDVEVVFDNIKQTLRYWEKWKE
jgi:hypothetical protein